MEYHIITEDRFEDVIKFVREHFPDEPLNQSVGLCKKNEPCELLEHHDLITMKEGCSLMAVDSTTGEIAGVVLNGISKRGEVEQELEELKTIDNKAYRLIFGLLFSANAELDLFSKYNVEEIFELRILSVGANFRGRGLAKELFSRSEKIAEQHGLKILKTDATSYITQRVAQSLGYETAKAVRYSEPLGEDGKQLYNTKSPHDYFKVMVKVLNLPEAL